MGKNYQQYIMRITNVNAITAAAYIIRSAENSGRTVKWKCNAKNEYMDAVGGEKELEAIRPNGGRPRMKWWCGLRGMS